jgi:hypothetical protein
MSSAVAGVLVVLGAGTLYATWPSLPRVLRSRWHRTRLLLWVLSMPYLAACFVGGIWFEAPRLVLPILLCEHVLRTYLPTPSGVSTPVVPIPDEVRRRAARSIRSTW